MTIIVIWLLLGFAGVVLFAVSEIIADKVREVTLFTVIKALLVTLSGPLAIALYLQVWSRDIVLWRRKEK